MVGMHIVQAVIFFRGVGRNLDGDGLPGQTVGAAGGAVTRVEFLQGYIVEVNIAVYVTANNFQADGGRIGRSNDHPAQLLPIALDTENLRRQRPGRSGQYCSTNKLTLTIIESQLVESRPAGQLLLGPDLEAVSLPGGDEDGLLSA
jgi:hypothetical protein